jgi:hypothetical protein
VNESSIPVVPRRYNTRKKRNKSALALLHVCRQMQHEARPILFDNCMFDFTAFVPEFSTYYPRLPPLNDSVAIVGPTVANAIRFIILNDDMVCHMKESFSNGCRLGQPAPTHNLHGPAIVYAVTGFTALRRVYVEMPLSYPIDTIEHTVIRRVLRYWFGRPRLEMHVGHMSMVDTHEVDYAEILENSVD